MCGFVVAVCTKDSSSLHAEYVGTVLLRVKVSRMLVSRCAFVFFSIYEVQLKL